MEFEYFPHTADFKWKSYGKTLEEAYVNSARAVINHMTDVKLVKEVFEKEINLKSRTKNSLFYDFIEEILFIMDVSFLFICNGSIKISEKDGEWILQGKLIGDEMKNYDFHGDVKAMTYNQMKIEQVGDAWEITGVADI